MPSLIPIHGTPKPLETENDDFVNPTSTEDEQGKQLNAPTIYTTKIYSLQLLKIG